MAKTSLEEFIREKLARVDESHTTLFLKKIQLEKDLENVKEQILMLEGAHQYIDQSLSEWHLHNKKLEELSAASLEKKDTPAASGATPRRPKKTKIKPEEV